ncbi:hypothetical protein GPV68_23030, partial [Salmonella enterica subsp. enterica serovar Typhimurium]|nr:hypothetical protein [Salmonella enterica subsp. enterica serovar Typhimurium]
MFTRTAKTAAVLGVAALTITACGNDGEESADGAADEEQTSFTIGVVNEHEA